MLAPPQQAMDTEEGGKTNTLKTKQTDSLDLVIEGLRSANSTSSSSSLSSSSSGSFDLLRDLNNTKDDDREYSTPKPEQEIPGLPISDLVTDSTQSNDWNPYASSLKQTPPVQTMGRPNNPPGYDPNRIPTSIFASKPASQADWSVASNESLFSIHMGNNSFSRDHAMFGKSGEFCKFDDFMQPGLPTVIERPSDADDYRMSTSVEEEGFNIRQEADITPKAGMKMDFNYSNISEGRETPRRDGTRNSASTHRFSDGSGTNSSSSFAFPLLTGEAGSNAQMKSPRENMQHRHVEKPKIESEADPEPEPQKPTPKSAGWFSWFPTSSCRPRCSCC